MFKPMYDRLYVEKLEDKEQKTESGLILSSDNKSAVARGRVIGAGFGYRSKCGEEPSALFVSEGDIVVFPKYSGTDAGNNHIFLREEEVLAIEVSEDFDDSLDFETKKELYHEMQKCRACKEDSKIEEVSESLVGPYSIKTL